MAPVECKGVRADSDRQRKVEHIEDTGGGTKLIYKVTLYGHENGGTAYVKIRTKWPFLPESTVGDLEYSLGKGEEEEIKNTGVFIKGS